MPKIFIPQKNVGIKLYISGFNYKCNIITLNRKKKLINLMIHKKLMD